LIGKLEHKYKKFIEEINDVSARVSRKNPITEESYRLRVGNAAVELIDQIREVEGWVHRVVSDAQVNVRSILTPGGAVVTSVWVYNPTTDAYEITFSEKEQPR